MRAGETMNRIQTLIDKEWAEVFKNKMVLFTVALMPLLFVVILVVQLVVMRNVPASEMNDAPAAVLAACAAQNLSDAECMQGYLVGSFMALFLIIPVMVPVTIAAYSIVGEKTTRSLEPLLATPVSTVELLVAKSLAATLPAVLATWAGFTIFIAAAPLAGASAAVIQHLLNPVWFLAIFVIGPLIA